MIHAFVTQFGRAPALLSLVFAFVGLRTAASPPPEAPPTTALEEHAKNWPQALKEPQMEVVFVLDTTGSMSGMIAGAKEKIWAIANFLKSAEPTPQIRFGLVGYRDRGDDYVTRIFPLSDNLDDVYENLHGFRAAGGGDTPESVQEALHLAVTQMSWSDDEDVLRVVFLVGDAPPHRDYRNDVPYEMTCDLARRNDILINTIQCGNLHGTEKFWRDIAQRTGGTYAAILQSGGTIRIESPYDQQIVRLNQQLNETVIPYGTPVQQSNARRNRGLLSLLSPEATADRSSYLSKDADGAVLSGGGDLTAELIAGRVTLETIDRDQLDPALQKLDDDALHARIDTVLTERNALLAELERLTAERDGFIAAKRLELADEEHVFELNAFEVLESQATDKGYRFGPQK